MCDLEKIKDNILEGLNDFVNNEYVVNPYKYLCERDIQSHLFYILGKKVHGDISIPNQICKERGLSEQEKYILGLMYTEYAVEKIDLACLDPTNTLDAQKYNEYINRPNCTKGDPLWDQPLLVGIELKFITNSYSKSYGFDICLNDANKLWRYQNDNKKFAPNFRWLMLCFIQDKWDLIDSLELQESEAGIDGYDNIYVVEKLGVHKHIGELKR